MSSETIVQVIINYSVVIYELGLTIFMRRSFTRTWNALQDYDEGVRQLGYPRKETRTMIVAWILTIVTTTVWTLVNRSGMYAFLESWSYNTGYMLSYVAASLALYKFVAMAYFLGQRFHHLNTIAIKNLPSPSSRERTTHVSRKVGIIEIRSLFYENFARVYHREVKNKRCVFFFISAFSHS